MALAAFAVFALYLGWIVQPHVAPARVINHAGLPDAEVQEIVNAMEQEFHPFHGKGSVLVILSSLFQPWTRPEFFVEIAGGSEQVSIMAGYSRGELWGGGPSAHARKSGGKWEFYGTRTMLWKS